MIKNIGFGIFVLVVLIYFFTDAFIAMALAIVGAVSLFFILRFTYRYLTLRNLYYKLSSQSAYIIAMFDHLAVEEKYVSGVDGFSGQLKFVDSSLDAQLYDDIHIAKNTVKVFSDEKIHPHAKNYKLEIYERVPGPFQLRSPGEVFFGSSIGHMVDLHWLCEVSYILIEIK